MTAIRDNIISLLGELPEGVRLVAAAKTRTPEEATEAIDAGVRIIGENYVREAEQARQAIGDRVEWHLIGHLQKNKVSKAVRIFDMIETVDSLPLAQEIDRRCGLIGKTMEVLVEVNSGREPAKSGVLPEDAEELVRGISALPHLRIRGLMTMGPASGDPENARPYFRETKQLFDRLKALNLPGADFTELSMGMTNSYRVAIEEGATLVRIGSLIFGPRT